MNTTLHALILILAIIIPGGLLVYFGWRAYKAKRCKKEESLDEVKKAQDAFRNFYPILKSSFVVLSYKLSASFPESHQK